MSVPYAEVIGDPIAHSKSPAIHGFWLERLGIRAGYKACHVFAENLSAYFAERRQDPDWRGCNVTIPHKQAVKPHVDDFDRKAEAVGAVNTIWRDDTANLHATNTDVDGVSEAIADLSGQSGKCVVIGAGGAARAAFATLASQGAQDVHVVARTRHKAEIAVKECGLHARILEIGDAAKAIEGASLLINATQLGMTGQDPMPHGVIDAVHGMEPHGLVFDMVYAPLDTGLLAVARSRGLVAVDGLTMLIGQAATAFERFFGQAPPRECDGELRDILTS